ncbi:phage tail protein [Veronia pacifica]|uniref:Phage tail protein n=1 Tax=Veronia pacifica TaxID=1080227 RepID=A0A1C3E6K8_9GAMM|nr:phage tail protein [Veronia pacifica]ODA28878.1 hypothetical protein A8L45_22950 [Veronia pacifica]
MNQHLIIGEFAFSVGGKTPISRMTRTTPGAFVEVPVVHGARSAFTGRANETININAKWLRTGAAEKVQTLRNMVDSVQQISDGQGNNLGKWTIKSLTEGRTELIEDGRAMVTEVQIQLMEYRNAD